jgi:hypothetical protein
VQQQAMMVKMQLGSINIIPLTLYEIISAANPTSFSV